MQSLLSEENSTVHAMEEIPVEPLLNVPRLRKSDLESEEMVNCVPNSTSGTTWNP